MTEVSPNSTQKQHQPENQRLSLMSMTLTYAQLQFHPKHKNVLLSGSTDGLVNLYDINIPDEDDALLQVINHGSIHHAGFLSETAVYALSHDETFAIHPITNPDSAADEDVSPIQFGDLRPSLGCEYVVQTLGNDHGSYLAAGNTTSVFVLFFLVLFVCFLDVGKAD